MIPMFSTEAELLTFARLNGYGPTATEKLLQTWKNEQNKAVTEEEIDLDLDLEDGN